MATATKDKKSLSELLGVEVTVSTVDEPVTIKSNRGRQEGQDIVALRETLQESMKNGKPIAYGGLSDKGKRDTIIRKIRQAAKRAGTNNSEVVVRTITDYDKGTVYWGDKATMDKFFKAGAATS